MFAADDIIHSYTREEAITDGELIELPEEVLREAGIKLPACMTVTLFNLLDPADGDLTAGQSFTGRLWDVLMLYRLKARGSDQSRVRFLVALLSDGKYRDQEVIVVCGPDDGGNACLTFMTRDCE